ncbi:hypothetical protein DXT99_15465 [Pontibacter diazotrophicus]|uniref:Uncharacterized protein n=1 Tax=Pontibacter diazotrophicus TaxID=1400979 RepID=A0A3D8L9U3_9BACT|nr:hypothetical protein [Pontibacter diazotrophicus]RDV14189.1 hypothetical protein DXT99_15465 [Pontibacter diazotrophicus]
MISSLFHNFRHRTPWFVANFDSCSAMAKALGNCLHGQGFMGVGEVPNSDLLAQVVNALPWKLQKTTYIKGSSHEAVDPGKLKEVQSEEFSKWATNLYPSRKYSTILIGSSSGAAVHLGAAMGAPWLPQTFLIPVKTPEHFSVDTPVQRMEWAREPAHQLLASNPDLQLHHMMDPNQDRPMLDAISYFRVKRLQLGEAYKQFISENLEENGTLLLVECQKSWPGKKVDERHFFQFGGLGGITPEGYLHGSEEVKNFLKQNKSPVEKWDAPDPDGDIPEAEWGFEAALRDDVYRFARENGFQVQRIVYQEPEDLSPFVADLYRWWYRQRNIKPNTLIADMFFLMEPYWTIRTGSVPFWLAFNAKPSTDFLNQYLQHADSYDNIYILPFSHGVKGVGLATKEDLETVLAHAKKKGDFLGSDPDLYPYDFGTYAKYQKEIQEKITSRYPLDVALTLPQLHDFSSFAKGRHTVTIQKEP